MNNEKNQRKINGKINVPGAFGHLLTNAHGATALFPDILLVEELVGGQVEGREGYRARPAQKPLQNKAIKRDTLLN